MSQSGNTPASAFGTGETSAESFGIMYDHAFVVEIEEVEQLSIDKTEPLRAINLMYTLTRGLET